jgi:predicted transcriptional regulator of viral defense system
MGDKSANPDQLVARLAARQHGVVSTRQLIDAGIERQTAFKRVRSGRMHRIHHAVYAVGHKGLSREGQWMAAVLACGNAAVLSHGSAAALWRLLPRADGPIHITVPGNSGRRSRRGIRVHRSTTLTPRLVTRRRNIPVALPARSPT